MTRIRTSCIVLRQTPFRESSLIVSALAPEGRIDFLQKGARGYGKRKFPEIGLFRELAIEYRPPDAKSTFFSVRDPEVRTVFDSIALHPETYLAACEVAGFLHANTHPMVESAQTYRAFRTLLFRYTQSEEVEPWKMLVKLAFLNENGLIPEPEREEELLLLKHLLAASQGEEEAPPLREEYRERLGQWIDRLLRHHGFRT